MTTMSEPIGGAEWVRQVNKRLNQLERIPRTGAGTGVAESVSASSLATDTSAAFEADVLFTAGEQADTSLTATMVGDPFFDDDTGLANDPYSVEEYDNPVPVEGRTDLEYTPVTPSDPIIESRATGVAVIWDGNGAGNEAIPVNLLLVEVHRSVEGPDFEPTELTYAGSFLDAGLIAFDDQEYEVQWWYRFVLVTNDGLRSTPSGAEDGTAHKIAASEIGFSASDIDFDGAIASANGNNKIWHEEFAPTNEANKEADTWFQHEPDTGVIIAQYTGLGGTSWAATSLSHQVISSVDLGTATVGKLTANYIESGVLFADITVAGTVLAGDPYGARVVLDNAGLRQYRSATDLLINFPTDGTPAQFEGAVLAQSLTVSDNFTLQGLGNTVARAAELRVSAGTTTPASPVSLAVGYQTYDTGRFTVGSLAVPTGVHGNVDDTADIYGTRTFFGYGEMVGPTSRHYTFSEVTDDLGNKRSTYSLNSGSVLVHTAAGAERLITAGDRCTGTGDRRVTGSLDTWDVSTMTSGGTVAPTQAFHLSILRDTYLWETRLGRVFSGVGSTTLKERFALANRRWETSDLRLAIYSATDSATTQIGSDVIVSDPFASGEVIIGVTYGDSAKMGFPGTTANVWLVHGSVQTYAYNAAGTSRLTDLDFPTPPGATRMMAWGAVSTNTFLGFRTTAWSESSPVTKLTNNHWPNATSSKWWMSQTWYDSDATGGTHETTQGARSSIVMKKRAGLQFTIPTFPERPSPTTTDDVIAARVYLGRGAADPTRPNMEFVTTLTAPTRSGYVGDFTFPAGAASVAPPSSNNFPSTAPGKVSSADGTGWVLSGDGTASIASVSFDATQPGFSSAAMRLVEFVASNLTGSTTTNSTGATMSTSGAQGTFTAPPSGAVEITVACQIRSDTAGQPAVVGFEVKTGGTIGSGTTVAAYDVNKAVLNANTNNIRSSMTYLVGGLTPGSVYNTRTIAAALGGSTNTYAHVRMALRPSP